MVLLFFSVYLLMAKRKMFKFHHRLMAQIVMRYFIVGWCNLIAENGFQSVGWKISSYVFDQVLMFRYLMELFNVLFWLFFVFCLFFDDDTAAAADVAHGGGGGG